MASIYNFTSFHLIWFEFCMHSTQFHIPFEHQFFASSSFFREFFFYCEIFAIIFNFFLSLLLTRSFANKPFSVFIYECFLNIENEKSSYRAAGEIGNNITFVSAKSTFTLFVTFRWEICFSLSLYLIALNARRLHVFLHLQYMYWILFRVMHHRKKVNSNKQQPMDCFFFFLIRCHVKLNAFSMSNEDERHRTLDKIDHST